MNNIPTWWLLLSGLYFFANTVLILTLIVVVIRLMPTIKSLSAKVDSIATKVDGIATTTQQTLVQMGERSSKVGSNLELVSTLAKGQVERHVPIVMAILSGLKILGAIREFRGSSPKRSSSSGRKKGRP